MSDWLDFDSTAMALASSLGLMKHSDWPAVKGLLFCDTPIKRMLLEALDRLILLGVMEEIDTDDDHVYRWNPNFKGSWED